MEALRRKTLEFLNAIRNKNFKKVKLLVSDPEVVLNVRILKNGKLPLEEALLGCNEKIIKTFLECPRVDWLAPTWNRAESSFEEEFGVQCDQNICKNEYGEGSLGFNVSRGCACYSAIDYFYYLKPSLVTNHPELAELVYRKMFETMLAEAEPSIHHHLLFVTSKSWFAFNVALQYCTKLDASDRFGGTLLHCSADLDVSKLLIENGADLNALDANERTPLMVNINGDLALLKLLCEKGANIHFINSKGESSFSLASDKNLFLKHFEISEAVFNSSLTMYNSLSVEVLETIFDKYPSFKRIFEENLPGNLLALETWKPEYLLELGDSEFIEFLKLLICENQHAALEIIGSCGRKDLITRRSNELLKIAVESTTFSYFSSADDEPLIRALVVDFNASPNHLFEGKSLLFFDSSRAALSVLLDLGADPFIESADGSKFYEMPQKSTEPFIYASSLTKLFKSGMNAFEKPVKTGKCFLDYLNPETELIVVIQDFEIYVRPENLVQTFIEAIDHRNLFLPIDRDGNTILHYSAMQYFDSRGMRPSLPQIISVSDLKRIKNKNGEVPFLALD